MTQIPAHPPGTEELGRAVGLASQDFPAVFMGNHGLVCWGATMTEALGLSEELESLAGIALAIQKPNR